MPELEPWLYGLSPPLPSLPLVNATTFVTTMCARTGTRALCRKHISYLRNIVGAGDVGEFVARQAERSRPLVTNASV
jgi:hypothetical protein